MTTAILLFILGFIVLIKGGDWFVDGATGLAQRFHIPDLLIGATVVSIGTTLPEVMVSATSALSGHGEIAYGNAIGSIICNTALIAAVTIAIKPAPVTRSSLSLPVTFFFGSAAYYCYNAFVFHHFSRLSGIVLLAVFVLYMALTSYRALHLTPEEAAAELEEVDGGEDRSLGKDLLLLAVGAGLIAWGANLLVDNGTAIAHALGVPESVIGLTMVALGTSLPELVTAITSLVKGHGALSLGNIIGANLFNLVLVSGLSVTLSPFALPAGKLFMGYNASLVVDIPVMLAVMALMTLPALFRGKLSRWQGVTLLCIYFGFLTFQFFL